jgi:hypothetical protein
MYDDTDTSKKSLEADEMRVDFFRLVFLFLFLFIPFFNFDSISKIVDLTSRQTNQLITIEYRVSKSNFLRKD